MQFGAFLKKHGLTSVKINAKIAELTWEPNDDDRKAAWEMYIELITRITTQPLPENEGDEAAALDSIYSLFPITREILKSNNNCKELVPISIVVLNQIIRPFTTKWHKIKCNDGFKDSALCKEFRSELGDIQEQLAIYTKMLADIAQVEDLTIIEEINNGVGNG